MMKSSERTSPSIPWLLRLAGTTGRHTANGRTSDDRGFSDLLNYHRPVADGVIVLKDEQGELTGPLLAGWSYGGPDFEAKGAAELANLCSSINHSLRRLDQGWMLHIDAVVLRHDSYIGGSFCNAVDRMINEELEASSGHYAVRHFMFLTQAPSVFDHGARRKFRNFVLGASEDAVVDELAARLERFEKVVAEVQRSLESDIEIARLKYRAGHDELLTALELIVNDEQRRCRPPEGAGETVDVLLSRGLLWSPDAMRHGDQYVAVISLFKYPSDTYPGLLRALTTLAIPLRWNTRFIFFDQSAAYEELVDLRKNWTQKIVPLASQLFKLPGPIDRDARDRSEEVEEEIRNLKSGMLAYGHLTTTVIVRGQTQREADDRAAVVVKTLKSAHFEARIETLHKLEALLGSFPGHGRQNVRKPLFHTLHLADLMPLAREWFGLRTSPCPYYPPNSPPLMQVKTWSGGAFHLNLHVGDLGHTVVLGPTRAGKSTLVATIASQFLKYWRSRVFVIDFGASSMPWTLARRDGAFYPIGSEDGLRLCPLAEIDSEDDRAWATNWVAGLCEEQGLTLTPRQRNQIGKAIFDLSMSAHASRDRTLTDLVIHLSGSGLEAALAYYTSGPGARVLNGSSNDFVDARVLTFETKPMRTLGPKVIRPTLDFIFRRIEKNRDGRPILVIIEEAWLYLDDERQADRVREMFKTWAKNNIVVLFATQSLDEIAKSKIAEVVFESVATKLLLPNHNASDEMRAMYRTKLKLTERQVDLITDVRVKKKEWYLFVQDDNSRLFSLNLGPVALSFVGATGLEDLARVWELSRLHGANWPAVWMTERGLPDSAARYKQYLSEELGVAP